MTTSTEVRIAGVPWPAYKLLALAVGVAILVLVGIVTTSPAAAVLTGAATTVVVWFALSRSGSPDA